MLTVECKSYIQRVLLIFFTLVLLWVVVSVLSGCKFSIPVDESGKPLGPVASEISPTGKSHAVTVDPDGTETLVEATAAPDLETIAEAGAVAAGILPPPWNLLGGLFGLLPLLGKGKK